MLELSLSKFLEQLSIANLMLSLLIPPLYFLFTISDRSSLIWGDKLTKLNRTLCLALSTKFFAWHCQLSP